MRKAHPARLTDEPLAPELAGQDVLRADLNIQPNQQFEYFARCAPVLHADKHMRKRGVCGQ